MRILYRNEEMGFNYVIPQGRDLMDWRSFRDLEVDLCRTQNVPNMTNEHKEWFKNDRYMQSFLELIKLGLAYPGPKYQQTMEETHEELRKAYKGH